MFEIVFPPGQFFDIEGVFYFEGDTSENHKGAIPEAKSHRSSFEVFNSLIQKHTTYKLVSNNKMEGEPCTEHQHLKTCLKLLGHRTQQFKLSNS